jgi:excisionase family DNA binding protein
MTTDAGGGDFPKELNVKEAAKILGVDARTVRLYVERGALPYRDARPPGSTRAMYRIPFSEVERMRTDYGVAQPQVKMSKPRARCRPYDYVSLA